MALQPQCVGTTHILSLVVSLAWYGLYKIETIICPYLRQGRPDGSALSTLTNLSEKRLDLPPYLAPICTDFSTLPQQTKKTDVPISLFHFPQKALQLPHCRSFHDLRSSASPISACLKLISMQITCYTNLQSLYRQSRQMK